MSFTRMLTSTAAFAVAATIANAADMTPAYKAPVAPPIVQASGYVEVYGGWASTKEDICGGPTGQACSPFSDRFPGFILGGAGRATYWWAPNASIQLDAQAEGTKYTEVFTGSGGVKLPGHISGHSYLVGGHASWRDPQHGLIGIFGGAGDSMSNFTNSFRHGLIGLEGQLYWGAVTLYGQVGYNSTLGQVSPGQDGIHTWFVRGTVRVYANPNFRLEGTVLYANGEHEYNANSSFRSGEFDTWLWRAKAEYKFATAPFSVFAAYEGSRTTTDVVQIGFTDNYRYADNRFIGGVRLYLGENTLQWNDNRGTTLDIIAPFGVPSFVIPFD